METVLEKEISQDTMNQVYAIAKDYIRDFFVSLWIPGVTTIKMQKDW